MAIVFDRLSSCASAVSVVSLATKYSVPVLWSSFTRPVWPEAMGSQLLRGRFPPVFSLRTSVSTERYMPRRFSVGDSATLRLLFKGITKCFLSYAWQTPYSLRKSIPKHLDDGCEMRLILHAGRATGVDNTCSLKNGTSTLLASFVSSST